MTELTDAELDVLSGDIHRPSSDQVFCKGCGAEWPCLESRAVSELRALRQQNAELDAQLTAVRSDSIEIARERNQLRQQNAALVTTLEEMVCPLHQANPEEVYCVELKLQFFCSTARAALGRAKDPV